MNKLEVIVKESNLEESKASYILTKFNDYFKIADEWEKRAKEIVVNDESQKSLMAIARVGRLELKEKRLAIEKSRKELKEQSLREGKAIDGIANVLKALIVPIEEYLDKQEHFIEYKKAEEERLLKIEIEKQMEIDRIVKEKAEIEERERIAKENEKLKLEAIEKEKQLLKERQDAEKKQNEILLQERAKLEAERKASQERERIAKEKADQERAKLEAELLNVKKQLTTCPKCGHSF